MDFDSIPFDELSSNSELLDHEFHNMSKNAPRNMMFPELNDEVAMDYLSDL